jgi:hypothetical protein
VGARDFSEVFRSRGYAPRDRHRQFNSFDSPVRSAVRVFTACDCFAQRSPLLLLLYHWCGRTDDLDSNLSRMGTAQAPRDRGNTAYHSVKRPEVHDTISDYYAVC